jgi:hypothetical protein
MTRSVLAPKRLRLASFLAAVWACLSVAACEIEAPRQDDAAEQSDAQVADAAADPGIGARDAKHIRCGDRICTAPALCVASVEATRCRCPLGYVDVRGDGTDCRDVNECLIPGICDRNGSCTNTPGSYDCECAAPALVALGNICVCAPGYTRSSEAYCLAQDGVACDSDDDCLNHHCEGGTCCAVRCDRPAECHTSEAASCNDGQTCSYPAVADGTPCDDTRACSVDSVCSDGKCGGGSPLDCNDSNACTEDRCEEPYGCRNLNNDHSCDDANPCTVDDVCRAGLCSGEIKTCASSDACTYGSCDPSSGECRLLARPDGTRCDDADSCTDVELCAAGSCKAALTSCGPNATACTSAQPENQCTCASGFVDNGRGRCVPENDECASQSVCAPDATCEDPSSQSGDFVCTCPEGWSGDGRSCAAVDGCAGNPCGEARGTCSSTGPGAHSCACAPGFLEVEGSCVCNLAGTFAVRSRIELSWSGTSDLIEPGNDSVFGYAIERFSYDEDGNLLVEHQPCGDGALDLCGMGSPPTIAPEAYAPYIPADTWDLPTLPRSRVEVQRQPWVPGAAFETKLAAQLHGIALKDPLGPWPTSRHDISGTPGFDGTAVNGARWLDHDDDGFVGITSIVVPPGGVTSNTMAPPPPRAYGASSPVCPREGGPHTPYAYLPATAEGATNVPVRVKRFFSAFRVLSSFRGKLDSCDEISGDIYGRDGNTVRMEARIGGCIRTHGDDETACNDSAIEFLDTAAQWDVSSEASFRAKRLPADAAVSCAAARAMAYD